MSTTTPGRWDRLAADLAAAGVPARLDERPYTEIRRGRVAYGVSRSITILVRGRGTVEVHDKWWRKNPDTWIGWEVTRADAEGIDQDRAPLTKKRGEVVTAVTRMLPALTGGTS